MQNENQNVPLKVISRKIEKNFVLELNYKIEDEELKQHCCTEIANHKVLIYSKIQNYFHHSARSDLVIYVFVFNTNSLKLENTEISINGRQTPKVCWANVNREKENGIQILFRLKEKCAFVTGKISGTFTFTKEILQHDFLKNELRFSEYFLRHFSVNTRMKI